MFETLGERRLSSYLLCGLSLLLPHLLPSLSLSSALALFPPERISHSASDQPPVLPTWSACCSGGQDKKVCTTTTVRYLNDIVSNIDYSVRVCSPVCWCVTSSAVYIVGHTASLHTARLLACHFACQSVFLPVRFLIVCWPLLRFYTEGVHTVTFGF